MTTASTAVITTSDIAPLNVVGEEMRLLVRNAAFEVIDVRGPIETGPPPHQHPWDEAYVILEGRLWVQRGEEDAELVAGQSIHIPANTLHSYQVRSELAHFLTITSPAGASDFFADVDATVASPEDMPAIMSAALRHRVDSPLFPH